MSIIGERQCTLWPVGILMLCSVLTPLLCYYFYVHILSTESGGKPVLPQLLKFQAKSGEINIPERIGTQYKTFGIFLLNDDNGAKVEAIAKEEGESKQINIKILSKWLQGEGMQPPTWSTIIEALKKSNLAVLAENIRAVIES